MSSFLHPVIYTGPKPETSVYVPGNPAPLHFKSGPDFDRPYTYAKESEAKYLARIAADKFEFPKGTGGSTDLADLIARIETLESQVRDLLTSKPKAERKPRSVPDAEVA
jgi:hypothetical protein